MTDTDTIVTYTVKELLANMSEQLVRIDEKLNAKADAAEVSAIAADVAKLRTEWNAWRNRVIGLALGVSLAGGGAATALSQFLVG